MDVASIVYCSLWLTLLFRCLLSPNTPQHTPQQIAKGGDKDAPAIVAFRYVVEPSKRKVWCMLLVVWCSWEKVVGGLLRA